MYAGQKLAGDLQQGHGDLEAWCREVGSPFGLRSDELHLSHLYARRGNEGEKIQERYGGVFGAYEAAHGDSIR